MEVRLKHREDRSADISDMKTINLRLPEILMVSLQPDSMNNGSVTIHIAIT
jgi:hypothetical protein